MLHSVVTLEVLDLYVPAGLALLSIAPSDMTCLRELHIRRALRDSLKPVFQFSNLTTLHIGSTVIEMQSPMGSNCRPEGTLRAGAMVTEQLDIGSPAYAKTLRHLYFH
ncbi:hypothetical protein NQL31_007709 [Lotmaria passim]